MDEKKFPADLFEANRAHLTAVAYRMLGSRSEAEDAVQEAWLRLSRSDTSAVDNLGGWLTTVVARICLDVLRQRKSRREEPLVFGETAPEPAAPDAEPDREMHARRLGRPGHAGGAEHAGAGRADRLRPARHVRPALRGDRRRSSTDRRWRPDSWPAAPAGASAARPRSPNAIWRGSAAWSMRSSRPHATATSRRCSPCSIPTSWCAPTRRQCGSAAPRRNSSGAAAVAATFVRRGARAARPVLVDGELGLVVAPRGRLLLVLRLTFADGRIAAIDVVADRRRSPGSNWRRSTDPAGGRRGTRRNPARSTLCDIGAQIALPIRATPSARRRLTAADIAALPGDQPMSQTLPIVDMSPLATGGRHALTAVADSIGRAARGAGFFYLDRPRHRPVAGQRRLPRSGALLRPAGGRQEQTVDHPLAAQSRLRGDARREARSEQGR